MVERGVSANYSADFECKLRQNLPLISLLGSAVRQQLVHGKLNVGMLWPISRETQAVTGVNSNVSVWDLCQQIQYTRRDDRAQKDPEPSEAESENGHVRRQQAEQMLYKTEVMIPGTQFKHSFTLKDATPIERACFMRCLAEFQRGLMKLGGDNRIGHGRISWTYLLGSTKEYDDFLREKKGEIKQFVEELNE